MNELLDLIREWAEERNLIEGSDPKSQVCKLMEEVGELAKAVNNSDAPEVSDGIGDCVVVLTILASQYGMLIEDCVQFAYDEIKDRKGRMVNNVFVKEGDV